MNRENLQKPLARTLIRIFCVYFALFPVTQSWAADIVVDQSAATKHQAQLSQSLNGTEVLNIAGPNSSGLSHNKFVDFNVSQQGLIINNSSTEVLSKIGGGVVGNQNMSNGVNASIILNEVTSSRRSNLLGAQELVGQRAEYILANPNGITCNGCGFINFPQITLGTGAVNLNNIGGFLGLSVTGGDIHIGENGLSAGEVDYFDIISRSISVAGAIEARDLQITAGTNEFDYLNRTSTATTPAAGDKPVHAIDSSLVGGMYAERIILKATEEGVGVRIQADMAATVADIKLDVNGGLTIIDAGLHARKDIIANTESLNADSAIVYADENIDIDATTINLIDSSRLAANNIIAVDASGLNAQDSQVDATTVAVTVADGISLNNADISAFDSLGLESDTLTLTNHALVSGKNTDLVINDEINNTGKILASDSLEISTNQFTNNAAGVLKSDKSIQLDAADFSNVGNVLALESAELNLQSLSNSGELIVSQGLLNLNSDLLVNNATGVIAAHSIGFAVDDVSSHGKIESLSDFTSNGSALANHGALRVANQIAITADTLENTGDVEALNIELETDSLNNSGVIYSLNNAEVTSNNLNNSGTLAAFNSSTISQSALGGVVTNELGGVLSATSISLTADEIDNAGVIQASNDLTLNSDLINHRADATLYSGGAINLFAITNALVNLNNQGGDIFSVASIDWVFDSLNWLGNLSTQGGLSLNANDITIGANSVLTSLDDMSLSGNNLVNSGWLETSSDFNSQVSSVTNNNTILVAGQIDASGTSFINNDVVRADADLLLSYDNVSNVGNLFSGASVVINTPDFINSGLISAFGITLQNLMGGGSFENTSGAEIKAKSLNIAYDDVDNNGLLFGSETVVVTANTIDNTVDGNIATEKTLSLIERSANAGVINNYGTLSSEDALAINFNTLNNYTHTDTSKRIYAGNLVEVNAGIINNEGRIYSSNKLQFEQVGTGTFNQAATAEIIANDTSVIFDVSNISGNLSSFGTLKIFSDELNVNSGAQVYAENTVTLGLNSGQGTGFTNEGDIFAKEGLAVNYVQISNEGSMHADENINLSFSTFNNSNNATISSSKTLALNNAGSNVVNNGYLAADNVDFSGNSWTGSGENFAIASASFAANLITLLSGTEFLSNGTLAFNTNTLTLNTSGKILADEIALSVNSNLTTRGEIKSNSQLDIDVDGELSNQTNIITLGDSHLTADKITNQANKKIEADNLTLDANHIINNSDIITRLNTSVINNHKFENNSGARFIANGDLTITSTVNAASQYVKNYGLLYAGEALNIQARDSISNYAGSTIFANNGNVTLNSNMDAGNYIHNTGGTIEAKNGSILIDAENFENKANFTPNVINSTTTKTSGSYKWHSGSGGNISIEGDCGTYGDHYDKNVIGKHCTRQVDYVEQALGNTWNASYAAKLLAGSDINIEIEKEGLNYLSLISAGNDVNISGPAAASFTNEALTLTNTVSARVYRYTSKNEWNPAGQCYTDGVYNRCFWFGGKIPPDKKKVFIVEQWEGANPTYSEVAIGSKIEAGNTITSSTVKINNVAVPPGSDSLGEEFAVSPGANSKDSSSGFSNGNAAGTLSTSSADKASFSTENNNYLIEFNEAEGGSSISLDFNAHSPGSQPIVIETTALEQLLLESLQEIATSPFFILSEKKNSPFLFETDPAFTSLGNLYGSDIYIQELGLDPADYIRLGDPYYELQLVREQIMQEAGQRFVSAGHLSEEEQFAYLLLNGAELSKNLKVAKGVEITQDHVNQFNKDVVIMVEMEVDGKTVLAPQLFLSAATKASMKNGAVFTASNIDIQTDSDLFNSGSMLASNNLSIDSEGEVTNRFGELSAGNNLDITATKDIVNESGSIKGGYIDLESKQGSIINRTLTFDRVSESGETTFLGKTATIEATNSLNMNAGEDILSEGAEISSLGDANLKAGNDITFTNLDKKSFDRTFSVDETNGRRTRTDTFTTSTEAVGSGLSVLGDLSTDAGNNLNIVGSDVVVGGNADLKAGNEINIKVAEEKTTVDSSTETRGFGYSYDESLTGDQTTGRSSTLTIGGNTSLSSGGDTNLESAEVVIGGDLNIDKVGGDLNIADFEETENFTKSTSETSWFGSADSNLGDPTKKGEAITGLQAEGSASIFSSQEIDTTGKITTSKGSSLVVGGDINTADDAIDGDINIIGSEVFAGGNLDLESKGDLNILAGKNTEEITTESADNSFGVKGKANLDGASGGFEYGNETSNGKLNTLTNNTSTIVAGGDMSLKSDGDITEEGSTIAAGGDLAIDAGGDFNSKAALDTYDETGTTKGVTVGLGLEAELGLGSTLDKFVEKEDGTTEAGKDVFGTAMAVKDLMQMPDPGQIKLSLSVDYNETTTTDTGSTANLSSISGGNVSIKSGGDANFEGTQVTADNDLAVDAGGDLNVMAAEDVVTSQTETLDVSVKVSVAADQSASAEGSGGTSTEKSSASVAKVASFSAGNNMSLTAENDVLLEGTNLEAGGDASVTAKEGDIDFIAARDVFTSSKENESYSAGVSGSKTGGSVDFGMEQGNESESTSKAKAGSISAKNISFSAKNDVNFEGTDITAEETASIEATEGSVNYEAAYDTSSKTSSSNSLDVGLQASKTGGGGNFGISDADSTESSRTGKAGNLSAKNLVISSGEDTSFEGTKVNVSENATLDVGGDLEIKSIVNTQKKDADSTGFSIEAEGDSNGSGSGSLKVANSTHDIDKQTNDNASFNIGGTMDLNVDGDATVSGKDIKGIDSVVTAGTLNSDVKGAVITKEIAEKDHESKTDLNISLGVAVPSKKTRKKVKDTASNVSNSSAATKIKNKASDAKAGVKNTVATASTKLKNVGKDRDTKVDNKLALADTKKKNNESALDKKTDRNTKLTTRTNQAKDFKADKKNAKADVKADKALAKANKLTDKESISDAAKATQKADNEKTMLIAKADNAKAAADVKKVNNDNASNKKNTIAQAQETKKKALINDVANKKKALINSGLTKKTDKVKTQSQKAKVANKLASDKANKKADSDLAKTTSKEKKLETKQLAAADKTKAKEVKAINAATKKDNKAEDKLAKKEIKAIDKNKNLTDDQKVLMKKAVTDIAANNKAKNENESSVKLADSESNLQQSKAKITANKEKAVSDAQAAKNSKQAKSDLAKTKNDSDADTNKVMLDKQTDARKEMLLAKVDVEKSKNLGDANADKTKKQSDISADKTKRNVELDQTKVVADAIKDAKITRANDDRTASALSGTAKKLADHKNDKKEQDAINAAQSSAKKIVNIATENQKKDKADSEQSKQESKNAREESAALSNSDLEKANSIKKNDAIKEKSTADAKTLKTQERKLADVEKTKTIADAKNKKTFDQANATADSENTKQKSGNVIDADIAKQDAKKANILADKKADLRKNQEQYEAAKDERLKAKNTADEQATKDFEAEQDRIVDDKNLTYQEKSDALQKATDDLNDSLTSNKDQYKADSRAARTDKNDKQNDIKNTAQTSVDAINTEKDRLSDKKADNAAVKDAKLVDDKNAIADATAVIVGGAGSQGTARDTRDQAKQDANTKKDKSIDDAKNLATNEKDKSVNLNNKQKELAANKKVQADAAAAELAKKTKADADVALSNDSANVKATNKEQNAKDYADAIASQDKKKADDDALALTQSADAERNREKTAIDNDSSLSDAEKNTKKSKVDADYNETQNKIDADKALAKSVADIKKDKAIEAAGLNKQHDDDVIAAKTELDDKKTEADREYNQRVTAANSVTDPEVKNKRLLEAEIIKDQTIVLASLDNKKKKADLLAANKKDTAINKAESQRDAELKRIDSDDSIADKTKAKRAAEKTFEKEKKRQTSIESGQKKINAAQHDLEKKTQENIFDDKFDANNSSMTKEQKQKASNKREKDLARLQTKSARQDMLGNDQVKKNLTTEEMRLRKNSKIYKPLSNKQALGLTEEVVSTASGWKPGLQINEEQAEQPEETDPLEYLEDKQLLQTMVQKIAKEGNSIAKARTVMNDPVVQKGLILADSLRDAPAPKDMSKDEKIALLKRAGVSIPKKPSDDDLIKLMNSTLENADKQFKAVGGAGAGLSDDELNSYSKDFGLSK